MSGDDEVWGRSDCILMSGAGVRDCSDDPVPVQDLRTLDAAAPVPPYSPPQATVVRRLETLDAAAPVPQSTVVRPVDKLGRALPGYHNGKRGSSYTSEQQMRMDEAIEKYSLDIARYFASRDSLLAKRNRETKPSIAKEARQLSAGDPEHWGDWKNLAKAMRRRREKIAKVAAEQ